MDKLLNLVIISPLKVVFEGKVISVTAPGTYGEFQVLYNHAPVVSTLDIGKLKLHLENGNRVEYSLSGGILEVKNNRITLLADSIEGKEDIDIERAKSALERAEQRLRSSDLSMDRERARRALKRSKNRLNLNR